MTSTEKARGGAGSKAKTILLHVGMHKTGTTALQAFLASRQSELAARGILYPKEGRPRGRGEADWGQHLLAWEVRRRRLHESEGAWARVRREIDEWSGDTVVISSEAFEKANDAEIRSIGSLLAPHRVEVILYVRNPAALLRSEYRQRVKMGTWHRAFSAFVAAEVGRCDYEALAKRWAAMPGIARLRVGVFERAREAGGIECEVSTLLGLSSAQGVTSVLARPVNASPSDVITHAVRVLNVVAPMMERVGGASLVHRLRRRMLRRGLSRPIESAAGAALGWSRLGRASDWELIRQRLTEPVARFADDYVAEADRRFLLPVAPDGRD